MTEREATIRRAVSHVEAAFPSGAGSWSRKRFETWVDSLLDLDADAVMRAAVDLVREWSDDRGRPPQIGHLRSRARSHSPERHRQLGDRPDGMSDAEWDRVRPLRDEEVAPIWWARLVKGVLFAKFERTGRSWPRLDGHEPYVEIGRRYELDPDDLCEDSPVRHHPRVLEAIAEARRIGEEQGLTGPAGREELVGIVAARRVSDRG